jgi:hypothetical protein
MFEHLVKHDIILVSGPQRSGTRIATRMIAADTGYRYIDEDLYEVYNTEQFFSITRQMHKVVVHCPSMSHVMQLVATDDILVVWMIRNLDDIAASEKRVNWCIGPYAELANLGLGPLQAKRYRRHGGQIAPLKYAHWWGFQREQITHWLELEFKSLARHPLWIPKTQRLDFTEKQTEL